MTIPTTNPVVSEITLPLSIANPSSLPFSTAATSGAHSLMSMEEVVAMIRRLEARFDERDGRSGSQQPPLPPDLDPPYGIPKGWHSPSWIPGGSASSVAEPTYTYAPPLTMAFAADRGGLGFQQQQSVSRLQPPMSGPSWEPPAQPLPSSWDLPPPQQTSTWDLPSSRPLFEQNGQRFQSSAPGADPTKLFRLDPPVFDGTETQSWVTRVQYYFDHIKLPENQRLHYVVMLFAPPTTDWIFSYRAKNPSVSWGQFMDDVRRRFDPNYYVNYIGLISKLTQTGSVADYNRDFEKMLNQIHGVAESTLVPIYMSGLRNSIQNQVRFQHPASVPAAMALAMEFDVSGDRTSTPGRRPWQGRDFRQPTA